MQSAANIPQKTSQFKGSREFEREWQGLCDAYLPNRPRGSLWWHSQRRTAKDLRQGWKLHVSATILSACGIFRSIAPLLVRRGVPFKAPRSLNELGRLNAGVHYGFSQVGKFVTVYPASTKDAVALAHDLDRLTANQPAPLVPYDEPLRDGSCVHYRYGLVQPGLKVKFRGKSVPAIVRPDGRRVPDRREPRAAVPPWAPDPFRRKARPKTMDAVTPLETDYAGYEALVQRGRGGVYRARRLAPTRQKSCIIKEGRTHGETDWIGRDGSQRIRREASFLKSVSPVAKGVPRFIATFQANHSFYLVMEDVAGKTLQAVIASRERLSTRRTLGYCLGMARLVADIHAAGWAWLDCKPANFLCGRNGGLRAVDFEGACRAEDPDALHLETPGYIPPRRDAANPQADDLFALGVSFAHLVTRKAAPPRPSKLFRPHARWRKMPAPFVELTRNLVRSDPKRRPSARMAQHILERLLKNWN